MDAAMRMTEAPLLLKGDMFYGDLSTDDKHCLISYVAGSAEISGSCPQCLAHVDGFALIRVTASPDTILFCR